MAQGVQDSEAAGLDTYLTGNGPWTAWFGAPPKRTLVITVRNPNSAAYVNPPLILAIGNPSDTTTHEATTRNLATIGPNAVNIYRIPVSFPHRMSIGEHQVTGIIGNGGPVTFVPGADLAVPLGPPHCGS